MNLWKADLTLSFCVFGLNLVREDVTLTGSLAIALVYLGIEFGYLFQEESLSRVILAPTELPVVRFYEKFM